MGLEKELAALGMAPELAKKVAALTVIDGVVAAGTTISDATLLSAEFSSVYPVASGAGVKLPDYPIGTRLRVGNYGANTLNIFPHSASGTIGSGGAGVAQTLAINKEADLLRISATRWHYLLLN